MSQHSESYLETQMSYHSNCNVIECRFHIKNKLNITSRVLTFLSSSFSAAPFDCSKGVEPWP